MIVLAGPLPASHDSHNTCQDMVKVRQEVQSYLRRERNIHFCEAGSVLFDQFGVRHELLDNLGLTLDGIRELKLGLQNI